MCRENRLSLGPVGLCIGMLAAMPSQLIGSSRLRTLTAADMIETRRAAQGGTHAPWIEETDGSIRQDMQGLIEVSPDGSRYVAMLVRGDLARNGNWAEIITGRLNTLEASRPEIIGRFFTRSEGGGNYLHVPAQLTLNGTGSRYLTWLPDNERVAFRWVDSRNTLQVFTLNTRTREVRQLTHHPTHVGSWHIGPKDTVVYSARTPDEKVRAAHALPTDRGFALSPDDSIDAFGLLNGLRADHRYAYASERFILSPEDAEPRPIQASVGENFNPLGQLVFSPDGRYALTLDPPQQVSDAWDIYTQPAIAKAIETYRKRLPSDGSYFFGIEQVQVIDLATAKATPLWDAPVAERTTDFSWSADGRKVVLTNTFLPPNFVDGKKNGAVSAGRAGTAMAEVDLASGRVRLRRDRPVELKHEPTAPVRVELRQSPNAPPILHALERTTHREEQIFDLNPTLPDRFTWGRVEDVKWSGANGQELAGRLYYPVGYASLNRYPLVLQDGFFQRGRDGRILSQEFSLSGAQAGEGLGPSHSVFAAQSLAGRGIAVLQITSYVAEATATPREGKVAIEVYESALEHLIDKGVADRSRIGLAGFSRTGFHVLYALTHSSFPYAAAIASDHVDFGYWQRHFYVTNAEFEAVNGSAPYGEGLTAWLEQAPSFNLEKLHTPLRRQNETGPLSSTFFMGWETFTRLRALRKPAELYVLPDIEHGMHVIQNPLQVWANKEGATDWFSFWLRGYESADPQKTGQYRRWRRLRELHEADIARIL